MEGREPPACGNCELGRAHSKHTHKHEFLNLHCPSQDSLLEQVSHLGDTPHVVSATPEFQMSVVDMLGDTDDHGLSRMLTLCWLLAHGPTESIGRVPIHPTPVVII